MCRDCYSYSAWDEIHYQRQGAVGVEDFYKEVNYQTRMKSRGYKRKNRQPKTRPGCPGNDFGPHVYVWTTETEFKDFFFEYYGFPKNQSRICVGCGKTNGSKPSDEYMKRKDREWYKRTGGEFDVKRGEPVGRYRSRTGGMRYNWFRWESDDAEYMAAKREYINRLGFTKFIYGF